MRTSVELEGPIVERPIEDVFAFISNLENSPRWGRTKKTVKDPDTPDGVGARFREEARILGEKVQHQSEIRTLDPPAEFSYANRFENGVIEWTRITLEEVEEGTRIDLAAEVDIDRIPRVLAPFVSLVVKQRIVAMFGKLEREFKPPDRSVGGAVILIAVGAVLLATAGLRYLGEVLPEGGWRPALALLVASLIAAGAAGILWRVARRVPQESEPGPAENDPGEDVL